MTARVQLPTVRGRQTQAAIDVAARTVVARKGILATTIADIAAEAGRSTASFYNYYDSKEAMVRQWALRFRDEARDRHRLAEIISVSQLAMINDDFAQYWRDICALPISLVTTMVKDAQRQGFCPDDDPQLVAVALVSMLNQFCYTQLSGDGAATVDDDACIATLANIFYRTIYHEETAAP